MLECKLSRGRKVKIKDKGINRYMLECKLWKAVTSEYSPLELIDTCWNVNMKLLIVRMIKASN